MSEQDDNFLSRWSRRKAQVRQGVPPPPSGPAVVVPLPVPAPKVAVVTRPPQDAAALSAPVSAAGLAVPAQVAAQGTAQGPAQEPVATPRPTLDDVEALTSESDFSRFIGRDVDEKVKNSAMKKLFTDPHYNVMDGLDTYIDDYNTPDPLPKAMLRQLVQARMLGLLDDELPEQPAPEEGAVVEATPQGVEPDEQGEAAPQSEEVAKDEAGADAHQPPESALPAPEEAEAALTVFAVPDAQPAAAGEPERVSAPQPAGASSSKAS